MQTVFTVSGVKALFRTMVQNKGTIWIDKFYQDLSEKYVNNRTYKWIYDYFVSEGVNMSGYQYPSSDALPIVPFDAVKDKKTAFTLALITGLLMSTPKYSKWMPSELLPFAAGFNYTDYRGTYERLFSMGVNLSEYAHPDVVTVLASGGKVQNNDVKTTQQDFTVDLEIFGSFFIVIVGLLILKRILR